MKLFELKSTVQWEWVHKNAASFATPNGLNYTVYFMKIDNSDIPPLELMDILQDYPPDFTYEVFFKLFDAEGGSVVAKTGTGESATVFATVLSIINEFITENRVEALYFSTVTTEPTRVKLYDGITKRFSHRGWKTKTIIVKDIKWYVTTKA